MNDAVIIAVANAITAQAETLKALIDALPKETKIAVEKQVAKNTPTVAPAAIIETPAPVVVVPTMPAMPAAPFPNVSNPAPIPVAPVVSAPVAPASVSPSNLPFSDHKGMMAWIMNTYQSLPKDVGAKIQNVMTGMGIHNINDTKPEQYAALYTGVEALKNG